MTITDLIQDIHLLMECEIVRFTLEGDTLTLLVVGDNEEDHDHEHEEEEEEHSCCEGLNGHLFSLVFEEVKNYVFQGQECDNYRTLSVKDDFGHLRLELEGSSFEDDGSNIVIEFDYETYSVTDEGKIESPDA